MADPVTGFGNRESNPYHFGLWSTNPIPSGRSHLYGGQLGGGAGTVDVTSATISNNGSVWAVEEFLEQYWALEFSQEPTSYLLSGQCLGATFANYVSASDEWEPTAAGLRRSSR